MIEKPNITDEQIASTLRQKFSLRVHAVEFLPLGWDAASWSYRIEAESGVYFLKLRRHLTNPVGILIPRFLKEQGIGQVMGPLPSKAGNAWEQADGFYFILYPFLRGEQVMHIGMSDAHWVEFGTVMKRLHTIRVPLDLASQIRRETFISARLEWDKELHTQILSNEYNDPFQKELAAFWRENQAKITAVLARAQELSLRMQSAHPEYVLCHADIHTANLLRTEDDRLFIVDWDETLLAPKECDLTFVMGSIFGDRLEGRAERLFFEGYGTPDIHPMALAYYRCNWCVEDMGGFAGQVFTADYVGGKTKRDSIRWFKTLFEKGNSIELALDTNIEF